MDGSRLYLGYKHDYDKHSDNRFYLDYGRPPNIRPNNATADEFRVIDTRTWRKVGTIRTRMPFWSAVMGNDGKMIYATAPQKHSVLLIDTERMKEVGALKVGKARRRRSWHRKAFGGWKQLLLVGFRCSGQTRRMRSGQLPSAPPEHLANPPSSNKP